jgi:hypothetical protein
MCEACVLGKGFVTGCDTCKSRITYHLEQLPQVVAGEAGELDAHLRQAIAHRFQDLSTA